MKECKNCGHASGYHRMRRNKEGKFYFECMINWCNCKQFEEEKKNESTS